MAGKTIEEMTLDGDAMVLQELIRTPMWDVLAKYLDKAVLDATERMVQGNKEEFDYYRGFITALKRARALPEQIIDINRQLKGAVAH